MAFPERFSNLPEYAFPRLRKLLDAHAPGGDPIAMTIGEPRHAMPDFVGPILAANLSGLRSGFVASGPESMQRIRQLRSFAGAPLPLPLQRVAEAAWADEGHVTASRALYQQKFRDADRIFAGVQGYQAPDGGFFLWLPVDDGEQAALRLWRETGVRVLPGAYLSRDAGGQNPGKGYIRVALVAPKDETRRGLIRLRDCLFT